MQIVIVQLWGKRTYLCGGIFYLHLFLPHAVQCSVALYFFLLHQSIKEICELRSGFVIISSKAGHSRVDLVQTLFAQVG